MTEIILRYPTAMSMRRVIRTWWPLAASWLLMALELPAVSAVTARLPDPEINLAAYGGVVFPLALIIEAPIIMLLAASTALSRDRASYVLVRRFMMRTGAMLTLLHVLVAFTPLYDVVVRGMLGAPAEIVEPARIGLMIMTPWTWSIAYRRFNQGVLIRFDHSRSVGIGTAIRLGANFITLMIGYALGTLPGIVVATSAIIAGVMSEALYVGIRVQPVLRDELRPAPPVEPALAFGTFISFYVPLALTSFIQLLFQPVGSAAMSRMPLALESLAVWPVLSGLSFMFRSLGVAYNEVVVALADEPGAVPILRRFTLWLSLALTAAQLLIGLTPLALLWFGDVSGLRPDLAEMARTAFLLGFPLPALSVLQSWYQGIIVNSRHTRGIPEAVGASLLATLTVLGIGIGWGEAPGLYMAISALTAGFAAQAAWLWYRSRRPMRLLAARDASRAA
ncbi:MAG: hypothetical protein Kow00124_01310 [Anaerolineae bacterium]